MKRFFDAIIGFSGSSEDISTMSGRFSAIIIGVVSKLAFFATLAGYTLPYTDEQTQEVATSFAFICAVIYYIYSFIRYLMNQPKVAGFLKQ